MRNPFVSIIIVNWNGRRFLEECFGTLYAQTYKDFEVLFVDNGSSDGSVELVKEKWPSTRILELDHNSGFAKGNNVALEKVVSEGKSDYVLLLNNDVKLRPDMLERLVGCAQRHPDGCIFGPKMLFYDRPDVIWSAGVRFSRLTSRASLIGLRKKDAEQYNIEREVDGIAGAALMIKTSCIGDMLLNEDYWSYYEETEFQHRIKQKTKMKAYYCPSAVMLHKVAGSSGVGLTPVNVYYLTRNRAYFIREQVGGMHKISSYLSWVAEVLLRICIYFIKGKFKLARAAARAASDFIRNKKGVTRL